MSFLNDVVNIFLKYYPFLLSGIKNTLILSLVGTVAGLAVGLLTGMVRTAPLSKNPVTRTLHKIVNGIIAVYVEIFRGTPMMVQAMVIYWGYAFVSGGVTLPLIPSARITLFPKFSLGKLPSAITISSPCPISHSVFISSGDIILEIFFNIFYSPFVKSRLKSIDFRPVSGCIFYRRSLLRTAFAPLP